MDPLSHTLLGGSVGYALFHRPLGRAAAAVGAVAALLPDADVFLRRATDPLFAVEMHRGFSHSLLFAPVGALLAAMPWLLPKASAGRRGAFWLCAFAAYVSHCLLDAATSYGTQLFWPFSPYRVGWDYVAVIDPAVTLPLLAGLIVALVRKTPAPAWVAVGLAVAYLGVGAVQRGRVADAQEQLAASRGHKPVRHEVMPTLGNLMVWRTLYLHEGNIYSDRMRAGVSTGVTHIPGWSLPQVTAQELRADERVAAETRDSFQRFNHFSGAWVGRSPDDATLLGDMRYSLSTAAFDPIWGVRLGSGDDPVRVSWINRSAERRVSPAELWAEIVGNDARYRPLPDRVAARD